MSIGINAEDWSAPQLAFIEDETPFSLLAGGFGSGKSKAGQMKICRLKGLNGNVPGLVLAQTMGELHANIVQPLLETLTDCLPRRLVPKLVGPTPREPKQHLRYADGARVWLGSADSSSGWAGINAGWLYGDEARLWPDRAWPLAVSRVRVPCRLPQVALTSTPGFGFLYDEFATNKPRRRIIYAPTLGNAANLRPEYVADLRESFSKRMQAAYLEGQFVTLEGAVYEALAPNLWDSEWCIDWQYQHHRRTYLWVDPGFRRSSWLFVQETDKPLEWVVFDQIQGETMSDAACVAAVNARKYAIDEIWCDPAADATQSAISLDTVAMLRAVNCRTRDPVRYIAGPYRSIAFGVDKVRTILGDPSIGLPIRMRFARSLKATEDGKTRGVVKDMLAYRYPEVRDGRPVGDTPLKDGVTDHANDSVRYGVCGLWLTTALRDKDPLIKAAAFQGYKIAA